MDHLHRVIKEHRFNMDVVLIDIDQPRLPFFVFTLQAGKASQNAFELAHTVVAKLLAHCVAIVNKALKKVFVADKHVHKMLV